jgi:hypothetical protein
MLGSSWVAAQLTASKEVFSSIEVVSIYWALFSRQTQQYTNQQAHISLCVTEFICHTMSLHVSAHGAILRRYINKPYAIELCILYGSIYFSHFHLITAICTDYILYCYTEKYMDPYRMHNSIVLGLLMYRLRMAPWVETCSDIVWPINPIMHSDMWVNWYIVVFDGKIKLNK